MKTITSLFALTLLAQVTSAQELDIDAARAARRYNVEIVVFSYAENVSVGSEIFPADAPAAAEDELLTDARRTEFGDTFGDPAANPAALPDVNAATAAIAQAETDAALRLASMEPVLMLEEEFSMRRVIEQLERLDAYEPIMHAGWTQTTLPRDASQPIDLAYFGKIPAGLEGSFMLYLGRYLHLVVDIALAEPGTASAPLPTYAAPAVSYGDARPQYEYDAAPATGRVLYRIQDDRIFKNGDIRYFDHPKFGVIAKIVRVGAGDDTGPEEGADGAAIEAAQLLSGPLQ